MKPQNSEELSEHREYISHNSSTFLANLVIATALTRSFYRDIKEAVHAYTPESVKQMTNPAVNNMRNSSVRFFQYNWPRLYNLSISSGARTLGFGLSALALWAHSVHLLHEYGELNHNFQHTIDLTNKDALDRYGHLNDEEIAESVYNTNRPF